MDSATIRDRIEGKSLSDIDFQDLKRKMYACKDPVFEFTRRFAHLERTETLPMPGRPDEAWRRFDFSRFDLDRLSIVTPQIVPLGDGMPMAMELVDGEALSHGAALSRFYSAYNHLSNRRSGRVRPRANDVRENRLRSINEALATRPALLTVDGSSTDAVSVATIPIATSGVALPQLLIHARAGSAARIYVVLRSGADDGTVISRIKTVLEEGSSLKLVVIVEGSNGPRFLQDTHILDAGANFELGYLVGNCDTAMVESTVTLTGQGACCRTRGLADTHGGHLSAQKLTMEHLAPHTESETNWHTILGDDSRGLFVGNIAIPAGATHSRGFEESHSLLLSDSARSESIPQLEIIENEVECSHGATTSGLDPDLLYYLQSRGLPRETVEMLLVSAFRRQITDTMELPSAVLSYTKETTSNEIDISDSL